MKSKRFQGLFAKAVIVLFIISMVPVLVIGYRTLKINERLLKNETLQKQQMVAERLAHTVSDALKDQEQMLSEFGELHASVRALGLVSEYDLAYLHRHIPSLFYVTLIDSSKQVIFSNGSFPALSFSQVRSTLTQTCLVGNRFISDVYYTSQGKPFIWMAEPLYSDDKSSEVKAVFAVALYLDDIINTLLQLYPLNMDAVLVSSQGRILSYNGAPAGLTADQEAALQKQVQIFREQLNENTSATVRLSNREKLLVSSVRVARTNWYMYLFQPEEVVAQGFVTSFFRASVIDLAVIILVMILFVGVVSYLVIIPITRPLARLREAAIRLRGDENFVVKRTDVEIPNNEIGDLASAFVDMSEALHERRQELMKTQEELAQMNQVLEERVDKRTKELQTATQELVKTERLAAIGKMASIISHEIRNPLAVIGNATRLIKTLVQPTERRLLKQFDVIEGEIRQANSIISEVLDYARTREMIFTMVDVNSFLRELVLSFPMPGHISVQEELDPENVHVKVDAEEIKQALRNIITNAVDAMPTGGTLTVGSKVGRRVVCLYVKDTGVGIPEDIRQEMFSPFFTTKARGTGLGLAVVRKAIVRHKGKLFIKSELGKGTCFCVFLKIYRKEGDTNYGSAS